MKAFLSSAPTWLAHAFLLLGLSGVFLGSLQPLGSRPWHGIQGWWTLRRFHQAAADEDFHALLELGEEYLHHTGQGDVLEFATYRVGYGASGPSAQRLPEDALFWARAGSDALSRNTSLLPDPWSALQTQSYILVERIFPLTHQGEDLARGLQAFTDRLAAGGGILAPSTGQTKLYRAYLASPLKDRKIFLLNTLERDVLGELQSD